MTTSRARTATRPNSARASARWFGSARANLSYALANHAPADRVTETSGALATAAAQTGHGVLAARGEWVTNEKRLLERAGLRGVDDLAERAGRDPEALAATLAAAERLFAAVEQAAPHPPYE